LSGAGQALLGDGRKKKRMDLLGNCQKSPHRIRRRKKKDNFVFWVIKGRAIWMDRGKKKRPGKSAVVRRMTGEGTCKKKKGQDWEKKVHQGSSPNVFTLKEKKVPSSEKSRHPVFQKKGGSIRQGAVEKRKKKSHVPRGSAGEVRSRH